MVPQSSHQLYVVPRYYCYNTQVGPMTQSNIPTQQLQHSQQQTIPQHAQPVQLFQPKHQQASTVPQVTKNRDQRNEELLQLYNKWKNIDGVKVLAHIIDGHVIIESSRPLDSPPKKKAKLKVTEKKQPNTQTTSIQVAAAVEPVPVVQEPIPNPQTAQAPAPQVTQTPAKQQDQKASLREAMRGWSSEQVADFIKRHPEIESYSSICIDKEINGTILLFLINSEKFDDVKQLFNVNDGPAFLIHKIISRYA